MYFNNELLLMHIMFFFNNKKFCILPIFKIAVLLERVISCDSSSIGHVITAAAEYHVPRKIVIRL